MKDNQLIDALATRLEAAIAAAGWNFLVLQKNQPTQEGIPENGSVWLEKIADHHYGSMAISSSYRSQTDDFLDTNTQVVETTFQISAFSIQDVTDLTKPTASDILNHIRLHLQSIQTISIMRGLGLSMMRVTDLRNPFFVDDNERFEANPTFDIVIQHTRSVDFITPVVQKVEGTPSPIPNDTTVGIFPVLVP